MSLRIAVALAAFLCGTAALGDVRTELAARGVRLIETEAKLDEADCQSLLNGLDALPSKRMPSGTLEVEVHAAASDFGMGSSDGSHPIFTDGLRRFHLYAYREPDDERALYRLEAMTLDERRALWRERAMVHAAVRRLDAAFGWSAGPEFRLPSGWLAPGDRPLTHSERPLNPYAWAYSRKLGEQSAALDLATFAEEALVPPSRVNPAHAEPLDDALPCQEFTRLRVLKNFFVRSSSSLEGTALSETPRCELFDAFARVSELDHIEVMFSAPSSAGPESLFGHLLVRPVWKAADELSRAPSFEAVMEIGAFSGVNTPPLEYVWHGLTGQSMTFFGMSGLGSVEKRALEAEQRSLTRYRMNLSKEEERHILERMWELERRGYFPYYFFTENCAAYTQLLLDPALSPEHRIGRHETFWVMPMATLDQMQSVKGEGGRPLVERLPVVLESSGVVAKREEAVAAKAFQSLETGASAEKLRELDSLRKSLNPADRKRAYEALLTELRPLPKEQVQPLVRALLRIERYAVDTASAREEKVKEKARVVTDVVKLPTGEELLHWRQQRFQRERPIDRYREETSLTLRLRSVVESLPMRPLTEAEQQTFADAIAIRDSFQAAAILQASLTTPDDNRAMELKAHDERAARGESFLAAALQRSGSYRLEVGGGAVRTGSGSVTPGAYLHAAIVSEELGDQRVDGFGPEYMVHLGELRGLLGVQRGLPSVLYGDVDVVNMRVLGQRPELGRDSLRHKVGFGVGLSYAHRSLGPQGDLNRLLIEGNLFQTPLRTFELTSFLSLGAGAAVEIPMAPGGLNSGLRSLLFFRVPLPGVSLANAVRGELSYSLRYGLLGPGQLQLLQEGTASVELPVFLGRSGAPGLVVHPRVEAYARRAGGLLSVTGFALLSAEWD